MSYLDHPGPLQRGDGWAMCRAVALACFLTALGVTAWQVAAAPPYDAVGGQEALLFLAAIWFAMTIACLLPAIIIGLPLTLLLTRNRLESGYTHTLTGAALGAGGAWLFLGSAAKNDPSGELIVGMLGSIPGGLTGLFWWLLQRRHHQIRRH